MKIAAAINKMLEKIRSKEHFYLVTGEAAGDIHEFKNKGEARAMARQLNGKVVQKLGSTPGAKVYWD